MADDWAPVGGAATPDDWAPVSAPPPKPVGSAFEQAITGDNGIKDRGTILPIGRDAKTGELELAWPETLRSMARGVAAFHNPTMESVNNPQTESDIFNAASLFASPTPGGVASLKGIPPKPAPEVLRPSGPEPGPGPSYAPKPPPPDDWQPVGRGTEAGPNPTTQPASQKPFKVRPDVTDLDEHGYPVGEPTPNLPAVRPVNDWTPVAPTEPPSPPQGTQHTAVGSEAAPFAEREPEQPAPAFYSALTKGVEALPQEKAPPQQWQGIIDNLRNKGVKQEEIDWSGVKDWLAEQKGPVAKSDLLDHLRQNEVQLREVTRGDSAAEANPITPTQDGRWQTGGFTFDTEIGAQQAQAALNGTQPFGNPRNATKYSAHVLPGGSNYREMLLTMPEKAPELPIGYEIKPFQDGFGVFDHQGDEVAWAPTRGGALANAAPSLARKGNVSPTFRSGHWDEPNILAHVRFDDRTGPNGEKVLHIAEVQSDWHQAGRRKGYQFTTAEKEKLYDQAESARQKYVKTFEEGVHAETNGKYANRAEILEAGDREAYSAITRAETRPEVLEAEKQFRDLREKADQQRLLGVPDAPFKTSWHELAMKRMLRYAAENGYDRVSWDTGETQADRYNLAHHLNSIDYEPTDKPGLYEIEARDKNGRLVHEEDDMPLDKIEETFGKDIAKKIEADEGTMKPNQSYRRWRSLSGLDLKVGGEGMKGFYDKILPASVNKLTKKWNSKVERGSITAARPRIQHLGMENEPTKFDPAQTYQTHSVRVTPEMKQSVMRGQPLFEKKSGNLAKSTPGKFDLYKEGRPLTPKEQKFVNEVSEIVYKMAPDAAHDVFHRIRQGDSKVTGLMYRKGLKKVIAVSLESPSARRTTQHEVLHFLKDYLSHEEWATLENTAEKEGWLDKHDIEKRYGDVPDEIKLEEAIASEFGDYRDGKPTSNPVAKVFAKLKAILDAIRSAFRRTFGTKATAEDIFKDINAGRVGKRKPQNDRHVEPLPEGGGEGGGNEPPEEGARAFEPPAEEGPDLFNWIRGQEDELTRLRGNNEADRTEALNYIEKLPPALKDPVTNERLYHAIEDPQGTQLTPEEQALSDKYIAPIRQEANEIFNRLRKAGIPIGMDGYVHRIVKGKGTMYDPQEGPPSADPFAGGRGLGRKTSSQHSRKMWMAEGADGTKQIVNGDFKVGDQFTSQSGEKFTVRQATTKEIEEGSEVRYFKNAVANSLDNLLRLRRVERNVNYLEALKQDPAFFSLAMPGNSQMPVPPGWKATSLPQLRGWLMEPRIARMLDNFYEVGPQNDLARILGKVNHALTSAIFVNPISALFGHGLNVATHWYAGRGWDNFMPHKWARQSVNAMRAFNDVWKQTPRYQQMLREGNALMYAPTINREFHQTMIKLMGGEIRKNSRKWSEIAKIAGTSPKYLYDALGNLSSKGLWMANDIFMLQRVYDLMDKGKGVRESIAEAEHEIPNYRIPSEAWDGQGGRAFSDLMRNPNVFIFSRYRYGLIHAYAKTVRDLTSKYAKPGERGKAAGQLLALGVLFGVLYPAGDQVAKWLTNNKKAYMRRAGPTGVLASVKGWANGAPKGDDNADVKNLYTGVSGLFGFAPGTLAAGQLIANRDLFTGKHIYNPNGSPGELAGEIGYYGATQPFPVQQAEELATGRKDRHEIEAAWLGINAPTSKEVALRRRYTQKDYNADKKAWKRRTQTLRKAGRNVYHSVFGAD